jgi:hypothetical protein
VEGIWTLVRATRSRVAFSVPKDYVRLHRPEDFAKFDRYAWGAAGGQLSAGLAFRMTSAFAQMLWTIPTNVARPHRRGD